MNIGDRVGDYEIVEVLGAGGMGQVYKVRNVLSERIEALKVLLPTLGGDTELADRFLREIKVQAALDHPNIAKLHTALRASNQLLMVMEFVEGVSLETLLKHGQLLVQDAVGYTSQLLDALGYAHARGVVHRDIKPANIMRTPAGTIKLLDFGIARITTDRKLTQTGTTLGSIYYMSPEQIKGSDPDPRSDLYSLGVVLYEMVTGKKPFQGDSNYSIMAAHLQQTPPPPIEVVPWVQGPSSDVIMKAIAKDPDARFQSAQEFRAALENIASSASTQAADLAATKPLTAVPFTALSSATDPVPTMQATVATVAPPQPRIMPAQPAAAPPPLVQPGPIDQFPQAQGQRQGGASPLPQGRSSSRRGLYMVLGSVVTLAVLALAAMEVPKLIHASANESKKTQGSPAPSAQATPAAAQPTPSPESVAGDSQAPAQSDSTATASAPAAPAVTPDSAPQPQAPSTKHLLAEAQKTTTNTASAPPQPSAEIKELREHYNEVSVSATAARDGVSSIRKQMEAQGVGLRTDVNEAERRMDYMLDEAKGAIKQGDAEKARRNLESAERSLEFIQKFLGH